MARPNAEHEAWPPSAWWLEGDQGVALIGGWSPTSRRAHFPPGPLCPYTGADDVERRVLPRHGTLFAWTAVTAAPPGYEGPVPYGFGIVELSGPELEGSVLRVVGRLTEPDPTRLSAGQPMEVVLEPVVAEVDGRTVHRQIWAFAPTDGSGAARGGRP
jgi:uncharacterized OB-fold protein